MTRPADVASFVSYIESFLGSFDSFITYERIPNGSEYYYSPSWTLEFIESFQTVEALPF